MEEIIKSLLTDSQLSIILILAGLIFLLLATGVKIKFFAGEVNKKFAGIIGVLLLFIGLTLFLISHGIGLSSIVPTSQSPVSNSGDILISQKGWRSSFSDDTHGISSISMKSTTGKLGDPTEISYNLQQEGWVVISKGISKGVLDNTKAIKFFYKGTGAANTLELKLVYPDTTTFGILWSKTTDTTNNWQLLQVESAQFQCWWGSCTPSDNLDFTKVAKIEIAISNKSGDIAGAGVWVMDALQVIK